MAALSCYQPCRSHLAQPARCLDEDERQHSATLSLRRRQFIERCQENRGPRHRDQIPEVSVKRTREELAKHASQATLLTRRLNVESGWSKVEEVRKKFESSTDSTSFSRSFESPPRRRLADSLFASFKLPRKKDNMAAPRSLAPQPQQKRKSAVELLAETKAFYVKSETVLDRKQELPLRVSSGLSQAIASGGCHLISSGTINNDTCCNPYATTRSAGAGRRSAGGGEGLQSTLRRLLEHSDSRENIYTPGYAISHKIYADSRRLKDSCPEREPMPRSQYTSGTFSGTSSSGTSGSKAHKSDPDRDKNRPMSFGDARVFFPESFVIPRQRPSEVIIKNAYSIPSPQSSPEQMELPEPVLSGPGSPADQLPTISPPAQYAHSAPRHTRSNSHSQPSMREEDGCTNINSHKSLPDLHVQAHCYPEPAAGTETPGRASRRRRHSGHHRTASCSSKGTSCYRSNHSSMISSCDAFSEHPSPGDDNYQSYNSRCGSSFARDSGGSSGHCTQRSAPPHPPHPHHAHPTTTHHEHSSRYGSRCRSPAECYVSAPPQFQDGAPSPPPVPATAPAATHPAPHLYSTHPRVGIHFQASAPPPQFQDEPPMYDYGDYDCSYKTPLKCLNVGRKDYGNSREYSRYHEPSTELVNKQPQYQEVRMRPRIDDKQEYVNASQICPPEEVTSPLGTFKRQRCLRYKQRRPRPILRSKSDISDRYRRAEGCTDTCAEERGSGSEGGGGGGGEGESTRLQQFFERLGLEARQYDALMLAAPPDSPVFFSSASTVDSTQLPPAADYTVQGPGLQKQIYRNTEPPSVVERNARIIKWLCQCRKTQMQAPQ
ncbi:unnamed protein product [Parnassius apollo]|uniref:(apollo) hypothetical protein n=1 Tax=Parnassius apollo TaxID=110799 RepID=A0A8S3Y9D6_PARAO|nr:unnamed protein product [Parnassius apollo]